MTSQQLPKVLAPAMCFLLTVAWILSIASLATPDWSNWTGGKMGIWRWCITTPNTRCEYINNYDISHRWGYSFSCRTWLHCVRIFSPMTVCFAFAGSMFVLCGDYKGQHKWTQLALMAVAVFFTTCAVATSICAFAIWLVFADVKEGCLGPNSLGPAWSLAVATSSIVMFTWLLMLIWVAAVMREMRSAKEAGPTPPAVIAAPHHQPVIRV